ncbi:response regulator transcription factor [Pedobacter boryungensis]|uniref:Response regulator transcription factor n=1 Tax=Pedobacter boryungensis TaxID=869962 RepID=A0ABX2DER4_9SPHI|nr:response regulator transcription factor [Pedobacter boryungensis]NQX32302.1 response regulator transcription factor [Pedobacter boryungensis]
MSNLKILFVEDEPALAEIIKESLESKGFDVLHVATVAEGLQAHSSTKFDLLILDVMLPDGDGFSLLKKIRSKDLTTPALFLTSKSLPTDVVNGFESGANDYLKKPFSMEELIIRIRSLLGIVNTRPIELKKTGPFAIGEYVFHYPEGVLVYKGSKKQLTFREAEILNVLQTRHEQMVLRQELLLTHWGNDDYFSGRSLDVFITKLRKYLKQDSSIAILNFRGQGYKLIF